jgi:Tfp pilus assembly protein PilV
MAPHHSKGQALIEMLICLILILVVWAGALGILKTVHEQQPKRSFHHENTIRYKKMDR